jgi:CubicO group peptidase (beta-lactamase class C family)
MRTLTVIGRTFTISAALVMATGSLAMHAYAQTEGKNARGFSDAGKAAISQQLSAAVSRGDTPGVVALVVDRDGVIYQGAAGKADIAHNVAMPVNAIFNIASMTKPVTSVAIMMLLEQHKLKLDDPVSKYLTGFDNLQVITKFNDADATYETRPARRPMTIRHLLAHTSGIGYAFTNPIEYRLTQATKKGEWELPLLSDPGEKWNYSASTRVLGFIVEKVTGAPLETWYQDHIFKPLGMVDTSFAVPPESNRVYRFNTPGPPARWRSCRRRPFLPRRLRRSAVTAVSIRRCRTMQSSCRCFSTADASDRSRF